MCRWCCNQRSQTQCRSRTWRRRWWVRYRYGHHKPRLVVPLHSSTAPHRCWWLRYSWPRLVDDRREQYAVGTEGIAGMTGNVSSWKSQFLFRVDAHSVQKATQHADDHGLWDDDGKAKVFVENGPIGVAEKTGKLTSWANIYRRVNGTIHATPGKTP